LITDLFKNSTTRNSNYEIDYRSLTIWGCKVDEKAMGEHGTGSLFTQFLCDEFDKWLQDPKRKPISLTEIVRLTGVRILREEIPHVQSPHCENIDDMDIILRS